MTRKFKATRPDPVDLLKRMQELVTEVHTRDIELRNVLAEVAENNQAYRETMASFQETDLRLGAERQKAVNAFNDARDRCLQGQIECMAALIEDMSE